MNSRARARSHKGAASLAGGAGISAIHNGPILRVAATLCAFLLGVYGFADVFAPQDPTHAHLADYAFKSLQLVVGRFPATLEGKALPWALHIARWALPVLAGWTSIELAWRRSRNWIRLMWISMTGDHLIVAGEGGVAGNLVAAERRSRRRVIIWTDEPEARWVEAAADLGAPSVRIRAADGNFSKLGLERARALLIIGPDDAANVALAALSLDHARGARPSGEPLDIIARVDDPDLRAPLEQRFERVGYSAAARLRFASLPDITARELFLQSPLDRFVRVGRPGRVVFLLGFSPTVERFAVRLLAGAHFQDGVRPTLVVLDPAAERKREVFFSRRPGAAHLAPVLFETAPVDQPALIEASLAAAIDRHGPPILILIDPPEAARALPLALAVANVFLNRRDIAPPIQVHMAADTRGALECALFAMGDESRLGNPELLLQEQIDGLARSIHEFYLEGQLSEDVQLGSRGSMHEWDLVPEAVRDDNRLLADCYQLKLRDVGARLVAGSGPGLRFEGAELEALAMAEHQRWMAAKVIDGWVFGETRDDGARRHPNIVAYDDLSDAVKDLDRQQIRIVTRLAAQSGRRVLRDLVCAVAPGLSDGRSIGTGFEALLAHLSEQYPDRAIVLFGEFEDRATREILQAGLKAGAPIQLTLARNPELTLHGLNHETRDLARGLYRAADRLFAMPEGEWSLERRGAFLLERADLRIAGSGAPPSVLPTLTLGGDGRIEAAA